MVFLHIYSVLLAVYPIGEANFALVLFGAEPDIGFSSF